MTDHPHRLDPVNAPTIVAKRPPSQTFSRSEIMQPLAPSPPIIDFGVRTPIVTPIKTPVRTGRIVTKAMMRKQGKML